MRNRLRVIIAAAAVTTALAGSTAAAIASTNTARPGAPAKALSVTRKPPASEKQGHDAIVAAVAGALHVSTARVAAALRPLFAAGHADTSSPAFAAAARSLGVSSQQLMSALARGKESLAAAQGAQSTGGAKGAPSEEQGHDAIVAAVAGALHVSTARVAAALRPLFAAGHADTSSPAFAAVARSLGVSSQQLAVALTQAKESLAAGS